MPITRRKTLFRWIAVGILPVGVGAALWWAYETRSARAAWERYQREAADRGVRMRFADFLLPEIAPEQNYAAVSLFTPLADTTGEATRTLNLPPSDIPAENPGSADILSAYRDAMITAKWLPPEMQTSPPAEAVLKGLERFSKELTELRAARIRPHARFSTGVGAPPLIQFSHLSTCMDLSKLWALSIDAHLVLGEGEEALEALRDGLRLHIALRQEPAMISMLVRVAVLAELQHAIQRGLRDHRWNAADLIVVDDALATIDLVDELRFALESERGFVNDSSEWMRQLPLADRVRKIEEFDVIESKPRGWRLWVRVLNRAEDYREQLRDNRVIDQRLAKTGESLEGLWLRLRETVESMEETPSSFDSITRAVIERVIVTETSLRQTHAACALERHRLAHGSHPSTLDALVPTFLPSAPKDSIDGQPMRYRVKEAGDFLLYSIGANAKDDGGSSEFDKQSSSTFKAADWVWGELWR